VGDAPHDAWLGTGFVAGPGLLMTNNHVASAFATRLASGWTLRAPGKVVVDFLAEAGSTERARVEIVGVRCMHPQVDLAVLELASRGIDRPRVPAPLVLAASSVPPVDGTRCYVIGYPGVDARQRSHQGEAARIFGGINGRKRLAPGCIVKVDEARRLLTHDSSTLGGNSGSCVVDLERGKVIGLHFGGRYLEGNSAVLLSHVDRKSLPGELNFE
jgi:S1-C subfamily serine protease